MTGLPTITVIIPAYNAANVVGDAVSSCFAQKGVCEIIVVDDGSSDNTADTAQMALSACEKLNGKVISTVHGGPSVARNKGLEEAAGEYVLFLDADDTLCEGATEELLKIISDGVEAVYPRTYYEFTEGSKPVLREHFPVEIKVDAPVDFAKEVLIGMGRSWRATAMLYSMKTIYDNNIRFAEGASAEDYLFNLDFLSKAKKVGICEFPTLINRRTSGSRSRAYEASLLNSILENDRATKNFLESVCGGNVSAADNALRSSLMMRSVVTLIFKYVRYENNLSMKDKTDFIKKVTALPFVAEALKTEKLQMPYFSGKIYTEYYRITYCLLKGRQYFAVAVLSSWAAKIMKVKGR